MLLHPTPRPNDREPESVEPTDPEEDAAAPSDAGETGQTPLPNLPLGWVVPVLDV